jgi:hypothetical protein
MSANTPELPEPRPLLDICREIRKLWVDPKTRTTKIRQLASGYGAEPYFKAMLELGTSGDDHRMYYNDTAKDVVHRFLLNARSFTGEDAKRIKAELKLKYGIK